MTRFIDQITQLTNAPTTEALWHAHLDIMASYGFERLIYCYVTEDSHGAGHDLGDPRDWVLLSNITTGYIDAFIASGNYRHGPMVQWVLHNTGALSWGVMAKTLASRPPDAQLAKTLDINRRYKITAGYSISFLGLSARTMGSIALLGKETATQKVLDAIWDEHGPEILELNNIMHLKLLSLPHESARKLTKRQREVLRWIGDGKTIQDAAVLMDISQATIEKHLRLAREALGVETTAQAVLKASFQNQIFVTTG